LFADKNGGFVIFDSLGGNWPVHKCAEYLRNRNAAAITPISWEEDLDAPVPLDAPTEDVSELREGQPLEGTVVEIADKPEDYKGTKHWPATIFTGQVIYRLSLKKLAKRGCYVSGNVKWIHDRVPCLHNLRRYLPPGSCGVP